MHLVRPVHHVHHQEARLLEVDAPVVAHRLSTIVQNLAIVTNAADDLVVGHPADVVFARDAAHHLIEQIPEDPRARLVGPLEEFARVLERRNLHVRHRAHHAATLHLVRPVHHVHHHEARLLEVDAPVVAHGAAAFVQNLAIVTNTADDLVVGLAGFSRARRDVRRGADARRGANHTLTRVSKSLSKFSDDTVRAKSPRDEFLDELRLFHLRERRDLRVAVELENPERRRRRRRDDGGGRSRRSSVRRAGDTLGASLHARGEFRGERVRAFLRGARRPRRLGEFLLELIHARRDGVFGASELGGGVGGFAGATLHLHARGEFRGERVRAFLRGARRPRRLGEFLLELIHARRDGVFGASELGGGVGGFAGGFFARLRRRLRRRRRGGDRLGRLRGVRLRHFAFPRRLSLRLRQIRFDASLSLARFLRRRLGGGGAFVVLRRVPHGSRRRRDEFGLELRDARGEVRHGRLVFRGGGCGFVGGGGAAFRLDELRRKHLRRV